MSTVTTALAACPPPGRKATRMAIKAMMAMFRMVRMGWLLAAYFLVMTIIPSYVASH